MDRPGRRLNSPASKLIIDERYAGCIFGKSRIVTRPAPCEPLH